MTPLVQHYMEEGLMISNVSQLIQYIPGKSLLPFADKVYELRCEATYEKDESKATTAKLFGNSGYGHG